MGGPGGMMKGWGGVMGGCGFGNLRGQGFMRDYVISAFADAVGLSVDQVNSRLANGETLKQIAIAQGTTEASLPALAQQVFRAALDKAVADGVVTQAQANLMLEHMNNFMDQGFSLNNCPMWDNDESQQP